MTVEEWIALPEDEPGEFVEGLLEEEEVPSYVHEFLVALLARLLANWILPLGGLVAGSGAKFVVAPARGRKPDLSVYFPGSPFPPAHGPVETPPDIAIEIVSPTPRDSQRDRVEKMAEYAAFGIRHYWILEPQLRILEMFELDPSRGRYAHALGATAGRLEEIPGCPGLTIDLDALWAQIDRLEDQGLPLEEPDGTDR